MKPWVDSSGRHFSESAVISSDAFIGPETNIWHFSIVLRGVTIGSKVNIGSRCEIGRGCIIGDGTRIGSGTFLPPNTMIGRNCFISPNVTMCDDKHPVVNNPSYEAQPPVIEDDVSIGAGCVILPGVTIRKGARIGAGSVVTKDVPSNALVYGERAIERASRPSDGAFSGALKSTPWPTVENGVIRE